MSTAKDQKPILKAQDMSEEIQSVVFSLAENALAQFDVEKDYAGYIKKELDQQFGHTWHVIVGKSFGSYVTHELGYFVYFYIGQYAFLVFKTG